MSGAGSNHWRGRSGYDNKAAGPRNQGGMRDRQGNRGQGNNSTNITSSSSAWGSPAGPLGEQHVPVRGFNSTESKDVLKQGYQNTETRGNIILYKPAGKDSGGGRPSETPWGLRPNCMVNGKDFFVELRKQVSALKENGSGG